MARAESLEAERDRLSADLAEADAERRQLAARLDLLEAQHAAAEQALFAELAAARAGRPPASADGEMQKLPGGGAVGPADALIMARSGLDRVGLSSRIAYEFTAAEMLPAAGSWCTCCLAATLAAA